QLDFVKASGKYLDEFKELSKSNNPEEHQLRQAKFFRVMGQGRETEGNLVEAFVMYKNFGDLPINADGVPDLANPTQKTPTAVWPRGRTAAMMAKATPKQREPLEAKIAEEWKAVKAKSDLGSVRRFIDMFDVPFGVGREARLHLASAIMADNLENAYLEAEMR